MEIIQELYGIALQRKKQPEEGSYTCYLFQKGLDKILKKCGEECSEMIIAAKNENHVELKSEIADLIYHIVVLCVESGLDWNEVDELLTERRNKIGNLKPMRVTDKNT